MSDKDKGIFPGWTRRRGDRYDGSRVRKVDPLFAVIPYILRTRLDAQVFYEERIPIEPVEKFIRAHKDDLPGLSIMQVFMTALVRVFSQRPRLNRFVIHNKIYARNSLSICLTVKRSLTDDGEETVVKVPFLPTDTLREVSRKIQEELDSSQNRYNGVDTTSRILGHLPAWVMRLVICLFRSMDNHGVLPRAIHRVSPWHGSIFLTNLGSIGVESGYHHLYEFGTCSLFASLGKKSYTYLPDAEGNMIKHKNIMLRFVVDERICDGFYYASAMRLLAQLMANPEALLARPENTPGDDGVGRP